MKTTRRMILAFFPVLALTGCASNPSNTSPEYEERPIVHAVSAEDQAMAKSKESLKTESALLYVNGMGCPLCASNIDLQLIRVRGVTKVDVDLGIGTALVRFGGERRPSPYLLGEAVADAGFTLVKVVTPAPDVIPTTGGGQ